jgi:hypothetical protein
MLTWLSQQRSDWPEFTSTLMCHKAAELGHLDTLMFLLDVESGQAVFGKAVFDVSDELLAAWEGDGGAMAAAGLVGCLNWEDAVKTLFDSAAAGGSIEMLQWLRGTYHMQPTPITVDVAAWHRKWRVVRWLLAEGAPYVVDEIVAATLADPVATPYHLDWLQASVGVEWSADQLEALMHASLQRQDGGLLRWLRARGVPWPANAVTSNATGHAICGAQAAVWALQQGCPFGVDWTSQDCQRHSGGRRSVLRRLHEMGAPCTCPRG